MYRTILADPPWQMSLSGKRKREKGGAAEALPYSTMSNEDICNMRVSSVAEEGCHLWLWTTNQHLELGFEVMRSWGFTYLAPIHWIKPSGIGNWFVHRSQTVLFGYYKKCVFNKDRYKPNILMTKDPVRHSQKPEEFYPMVEGISDGPRLEIFARDKREGWDVWGNQAPESVDLDLLCLPGSRLPANIFKKLDPASRP